MFRPFVVLSLLALFALARANDMQQRSHVALNKRIVKKRLNIDSFVGRPAAGAESIPTPAIISSSVTTSSTALVTSSSSSLQASTSLSTLSTSETPSSTSTTLSSTSSTSFSSTTSSASSTTTSLSSSTLSPETINVTQLSNPVSTVTPTITRTQSVDAAAENTSVAAPMSEAAKTKSTTMTVLIAVAASVGGLAILWTIFRKWKLSSSKKFDERMNPISWQPTTGDDGVIPNHRRVPSSSSSFHSGSGHGHASSNGHSAGFPSLEHDFTAGPVHLAPVGGYADLARGSSPIPPMQELAHGPGYDGIPLHHQTGFGNHDAYDYNGGSTRY